MTNEKIYTDAMIAKYEGMKAEAAADVSRMEGIFDDISARAKEAAEKAEKESRMKTWRKIHEEGEPFRAPYAEALKRQEYAELLLSYARENETRIETEENLSALEEILMKYNGKRYGERTEEKIREAFKEKTGAWVFIHRPQYNGASVTISFSRNNGYITAYKAELFPRYVDGVVKNILEDNVIRAENLKHYALMDCRAYDGNIEETAENFLKASEALKAAKEALKAAQDDYNNLKPTNVKAAY